MPPSEEPPDIHDLCRLRSTLEAFALNCLHRDPDRPAFLEKMGHILLQMKEVAQRADYGRFHTLDMTFHRTLVESCHLPALGSSWEIVSKDLDQWLQKIKKTCWPNLVTLYHEHELLLQAISSPLEWVGEQAVHQHIESGWYRIALAEGRMPDTIDPVDRADAFISTHFASHFDIEYVARNVSFVSPSHLTRLFRKKLGTSPYARLRRTRLGHAAELLVNSAERISAIAMRTGYKSTSHFIKDFHIIYKKTPAQYRRTAAAATLPG